MFQLPILTHPGGLFFLHQTSDIRRIGSPSAQIPTCLPPIHCQSSVLLCGVSVHTDRKGKGRAECWAQAGRLADN